MKNYFPFLFVAYLALPTHALAWDDDDVPGRGPPMGLTEDRDPRSNLSGTVYKNPENGLVLKGKITKREVFLRGTIPLQEPTREPERRNQTCTLSNGDCLDE